MNSTYGPWHAVALLAAQATAQDAAAVLVRTKKGWRTVACFGVGAHDIPAKTWGEELIASGDRPYRTLPRTVGHNAFEFFAGCAAHLGQDRAGVFVMGTEPEHDPFPALRASSRQVQALLKARQQRRALATHARTRIATSDAERDRAEVLGMLAHDVKNPVAALLLDLDVLKMEAKDERTLSRLERVSQSAHRVVDVAAGLVDVARLRAGSQSLTLHPWPTRELVDESLDRVRPLADKAKVQLAVEAPAQLPDVKVDPPRIEQVLFNLLDNAIRFTAAGGTVRVAVSDEPQGVVIRVKDEGPGLPAGDGEKVFERYWRGAQKERRPEGAGLGLYISKTLVEAHGGHLWVESPPTGGAAFAFNLQRADD